MQRFRLFARVIATIWLVCQAASVAAFVPGSCCISHSEEAAAKKAAETQPCHGEQPAPDPGSGPAHHGEGGVCPMHSSKDANCCAMTNACQGPGSQLAHLFAFLGLLEAPAVSVTPIESTPSFIASDAPPLSHLTTSDAPPPKA